MKHASFFSFHCKCIEFFSSSTCLSLSIISYSDMYLSWTRLSENGDQKKVVQLECGNICKLLQFTNP